MTMFRRLALCALAALMLAAQALALDQSQAATGPLLLDEFKSNNLYVRELAVLDGQLLLVSNDTLYRIDTPTGQFIRHAVSGLLTQDAPRGSRYNWQLVPGDAAPQLIDTETGLLYPLTFAEQQPALGAPRALDWGNYRVSLEGGHSYVDAPPGYVMAGDTLLALERHPAGQGFQLTAFDAQGKRRPLETPIVLSAAPFAQGQALVLTSAGRDEQNTWQNPTVSILNPQTGELTEKLQLAPQGTAQDANAMRITYDKSEDVLYAQLGQHLLRYDRWGQGQPCGTFPADSIYEVLLCPLGQDRLAASLGSAGIRVMDTNARRFADKPPLTIWGDPYLPGFSQAVGLVDDLNVRLREGASTDGLNAALISGDDTFDVAVVRLESTDFQSIMRKGYAADLSGSDAIRHYVEDLYPSILQAVGRDESIFALPVDGYGFLQLYEGFFFEKTGHPLPRTVAELVDFIEGWPTRYAVEWPQMEPIYMAAYKRTLAQVALDIYQDAMRYRGGTFTYDTPLLRRMLSAIDALPDGAGEDSAPMENNGEFRMEVLPLREQIRDFHAFRGEGRDSYTFYPLLLAADDNEPAVMRLEVTALFINPRTKNLDGAMRFLENYISVINPELRMLFSPDMNKPIPNPRHEEQLAAQQAHLDDLTARRDKAQGAERTELQRLVDISTKDLADMREDGRWLVSEETIAAWRAMAEHNYVNQRTGDNLASEEVYSLFSRYLEGQMDLEQFVREAEAKTRLIMKESQ